MRCLVAIHISHSRGLGRWGEVREIHLDGVYGGREQGKVKWDVYRWWYTHLVLRQNVLLFATKLESFFPLRRSDRGVKIPRGIALVCATLLCYVLKTQYVLRGNTLASSLPGLQALKLETTRSTSNLWSRPHTHTYTHAHTDTSTHARTHAHTHTPEQNITESASSLVDNWSTCNEAVYKVLPHT